MSNPDNRLSPHSPPQIAIRNTHTTSATLLHLHFTKTGNLLLVKYRYQIFYAAQLRREVWDKVSESGLTLTPFVWPTLWALSSACINLVGSHNSSANTTVLAAVRVTPTYTDEDRTQIPLSRFLPFFYIQNIAIRILQA